jgi:coenzyme A diphosphatase NUDT7
VAYVFSVPVSYFERAEPEKYQTEIIVNPVRINEDGKEEMIFPAKELKLPDKYHRPWQGRKHNVYVYRYQGEVIWGITAAFIYDLINKYMGHVLKKGSEHYAV